MSQHTSDIITADVLRSLEPTSDPRLREILLGLVRHMHDFAREVRLTTPELIAAAAFLTRAGQISDPARHEFLLLSDTLGLTMVVDANDNAKPEGAFESSVLGPFYRDDAPVIRNGESIARRGAADGEPALVSGRVLSRDRRPLAGAWLDIWQAAENGLYENMDPNQPELNLRGRVQTDKDGGYAFWTVKPSSYPIPNDGPAGILLQAAGRHHFRPAHIHFIVSAEGFDTVTSEIFTEGDEYLASDVVFGVKPSLLAGYRRHDDPAEAARHGVSSPFYTMTYDFVLVAGRAKAAAFSAGRGLDAEPAIAAVA